MRSAALSSLVSALAFANSVFGIEHAAVYRFNQLNDCSKGLDADVAVIPQQDATLNLAYDFGISKYYNVEGVEDIENIMLQNVIKADSEKDAKKLILVVNGVDEPRTFLANYDIAPSFEIDIRDDRKSSEFKTFLRDVPNKLFNLKRRVGYHLDKLSNEITILTDSNKKSTYLKQLWTKYFHDEDTNKIEKFWNNLKQNFNEEESVLRINKRSVDYINDESFINELTQLDFFLNDQLENHIENDNVIINVDSLVSIFKKTGVTQTYETCTNIISKLLVDKLSKFDDAETTIVVLPIDQSLMTLKTKESFKRSQMLSKRSTDSSIFKSKRSGTSCFANELACLESTESCSGHGVCSAVGSCWRCLCSATKDENERTSYWTGTSCEKEDFSSQFNLLFWTSVVLIVSLVSGVKLMYKCGDEELPGVLLAATVQTKKNT